MSTRKLMVVVVEVEDGTTEVNQGEFATYLGMIKGWGVQGVDGDDSFAILDWSVYDEPLVRELGVEAMLQDYRDWSTVRERE